MAVYNVDENLTHVLLTAMHTCFMSHLLVLVLVLLQLVLTATLVCCTHAVRSVILATYQCSVVANVPRRAGWVEQR